MTEEQTQSAELTRIEEWTRQHAPRWLDPWPDIVAWMKNREATEALLLRMVEEKLIPAAQNEPGTDPRSGWQATPQPATDTHVHVVDSPTLLYEVGTIRYCTHYKCGERLALLWVSQPPAPQQTEG